MSEERRPVVIPPGWNATPPERLPRAAPWPAMFAFAVMLVAWGLISSALLVLIGGALLFYALLHWIGEIRHDAK
jgi:hypothetical protein